MTSDDLMEVSKLDSSFLKDYKDLDEHQYDNLSFLFGKQAKYS